MAKDVTDRTVLAYFFGAWVLLAICLQTYGVFSRNVLAMSTVWVDDLQRLNFIWLIWICAALAYGGRGLVALDLVVSKFTGRPRIYYGITMALTLVEIGFGAVFASLSTQLVLSQQQSGETTVGLSIPLSILDLGFAIGCVLIFVFGVRKLILTTKHMIAATPVETDDVEDILAKGD